MAITTDDVMTNTVPTVLEKARFVQRFKAIMASLCWNIRKELHDGKNINVPVFTIVTADSLTEGEDMVTSKTMDDDIVTITPGEVGCKIILTDKLVRDNNEDIKAAAGRILGEAMEYKRDYDLLEQIDDASSTPDHELGDGTGALTMGQIAAARALLSGNSTTYGGPAPQPYACVHHPYVLLDLVDVMTPTNPAVASLEGVGVAGDIIKNYTVGRLFGMPIVEDGNLATTSDVAKGGVFATGEGGSIILGTADEWNVEPERDASLRATELNIVGEYGVGEYEEAWIVELSCDATTPS